MDRLRTPDDRFDALPGFPWEPRYVEVDDPDGGDPLRMAVVDEGPRDAAPLVLLHGEPSWSYLYRHMIPPLLEAGHRVVAPDLIGFGRSDKPSAVTDHTYARHVAWVRQALVDQLDLTDMTVFVQDWGGLIGLRVLAEAPDRFARVVAGNTGLPTGDQRMPDAFHAWRELATTIEVFPVGTFLQGATTTELPDDVVAAYDAPFPDESYKAGARAMPALVPVSPDDPAHDDQIAAWGVLGTFARPFHTCFSDQDPITAGADAPFRTFVPGAADALHTTTTGAGHFLQEDAGPELAAFVLRAIAHDTT